MNLADGDRWRQVAVVLAGACAALCFAGAFGSAAHASSAPFGTTGLSPVAIAIDSAGNIYTANQDGNNVTKITPAGNSSTLLIAGGTRPTGIAVDFAGNVYTTNQLSQNVTKITPGGVATILELAGGTGPTGIAVDSAGNVYTANQTTNNVTKITPSGVSTIIELVDCLGPMGVAIDAADNVYITNSNSSNVAKITPEGISTILSSTGAHPKGITVDAAGNVYTTNEGDHMRSPPSVSKITPQGVSTINWADPGSSTRPVAITIDSAGNLYIADQNSGNVSKITPAGLSSALASTGSGPTGITIDSAGNIYTANAGAANVTRITPTVTSGTPDIFPAPPAKPSAPTAVAGIPGSGSATITVATNPISAAFGTPTSYTVSTSQDASKQCVVTNPNVSCSIAGLTIGTDYTFTARANLSNWQTVASSASNSVTPAAVSPVSEIVTPTASSIPPGAPTPPTNIHWTTGPRTTNQPITGRFAADANTTYTVTATSNANRRTRTARGTCKITTNKTTNKRTATCSIRLKHAGKWFISITPTQNGLVGTPATKTIKIHAPARAPQPAEPVTG
jgi:streptogramin lyase